MRKDTKPPSDSQLIPLSRRCYECEPQDPQDAIEGRPGFPSTDGLDRLSGVPAGAGKAQWGSIPHPWVHVDETLLEGPSGQSALVGIRLSGRWRRRFDNSTSSCGT